MGKEVELKQFLEIEKKHRLYEDTIDGINYWVYSRFIIWNDIIVKNKLGLGEGHNKNKMTLYDKGKIIINLIKNSLFSAKVPEDTKDVLFITHPRRVLEKGLYECIYTDELAKEFRNYAVFEQPYQWQHMEPMVTSNVILGDYILLRKGIYFAIYKIILKKKYVSLIKEIERRAEKPLIELESVYEVKLDKKKIFSIIAEQILFYKGSEKSVVRLIEKLNPKVVVEVVGYNPFCMLVNEKCKEKGIVTIELQHGTMSKHGGYEYHSDKEIKQFPDKMFLFSDFWKEQIHVPIKDENLIITGYPYFERKLKEATPIQEYEDGKINILFISQGLIGKQLSKLACQLSEKLDRNKYRVLYKLHPGEYAVWKENYKELNNDNIVAIYDNRYSLYDYFATCQIQVGVCSTAIYEGLGLGLHTFIYKIELSEHMTSLCKNGYAEFVENVEVLYDKILLTDIYRDSKRGFWKENALSNMKEYLENFLNI